MEILGSKSSRPTILASASLAILCLFYIYTVGTFLQIRTYPLVDRVTYYTNFDFYIVSEFADHVIIGSLLILWLALSIRSKIGRIMIGVFAAFFFAATAANFDAALDGIALAALPAIISLMIYNWYSRKTLYNTKSNLTLNYLAVVGIITGLISFSIALYSIGLSGNESTVRSYAHEIFLLFSSFSPILILLLITAFPLKLLIDFVRARIKQPHLASDSFDHKELSMQTKIVYLSLFVILSIGIASIPHLPAINKDNQLVGVDTLQYSIWIDEMKNARNIEDLFDQIFVKHSGGDRPLSLILILLFQATVGSTNDDLVHTIEYLSIVLGPLLVLVIYFLTKELTANDKTSLYGAFLTAVSFHVLIGIYAGFYANWIGLIFGYLSFVFLFRFLKMHSLKNLAWYGIFLTLTLFSHVYTWSIVAIVTGIFLGVFIIGMSLRKQNRNGEISADSMKKKGMTLLLIVLLCTVAIDVGRAILTGSSGGIERDLQIGQRGASLEQFALRWNNLTYTSTVYVGGLFANFIIFGLGLYWLFTFNIKERQNVFMIIFLSIGILPFLFGDWIIQTRVFYDIPFQIPAALALSRMARQSYDALWRSIPIHIWIIAISVMAVSHFYLVLNKI